MSSHTRKPSSRVSRRWFGVATLVVATFALGFQGFQQYFALRAESRSVADIFYLTLQLFTLESGAVEPPIPSSLQWARFLGAMASVYAIIITLMRLFGVQIQRAAIWLFGGHVIVCALGRKGDSLVKQLRSQRRRVAVIEADEQNPQLDHCRELGCYVIIGRANDDWMLRRAFLSRASAVLALAGDDGVNVETAVRAHEIAQRRPGKPLRCVIHVSEPKLQLMFKQHDIYTSEQDPFDLEFVNTFELSARVMAREAEAAIPTVSDAVHYLVVGLGHFGQALVKRVLKDWHIEAPTHSSAPRLTIIDVHAEQRLRHFETHDGDLATGVELSFVQCDIHHRRKTDQIVRQAMEGCGRIDVAFVCLDDDSKASYAALALRKSLLAETPIYVRMSEEAGLATLLGTKHGGNGVIANVCAIGMLDIACDVDLVMGGTRELLAQAIHQGYVQDQLAAGKTVVDNPSMRAWHRLSDHLKNSNRKQADHIDVKLKMIGCELQAKPDGFISVLEFTESEIERLALVEHQRWLDQQRISGWTWGEQKDEVRRTNPNIVAWEELTEEVRCYNHDCIRRIPKVLARADFEILRTDE